jgi:thiamine-phosphate pyrophosphorylase
MGARRHKLPSALYPITDLRASGCASHALLTRALVAGGARWVQLRDKEGTAAGLLGDFRAACRLLRGSGGHAVVNDRADLALACGAAGVHLGEEDLPAEAARRVLGERALIGVSTHTPEAAEQASYQPVDYVAIGPVFDSPSKPGAHPRVGMEGLRAARLRVARPLVAIGGIGADQVGEVLRAGADAAAMISAVCTAPEGIERRMRELRHTARAALAARPLRGRHVYLIGFMGAGKSTLGPLVARALGRPFVDLDREIERRAGAVVADLFAARGEPHFRRLERRALREVSRGRDAVVALGGGALGSPANAARIRRTGVRVWLDAPVAVLRRRCLAPGAPERPLLRDAGAFARLYLSRRFLYAAAELRLATGRHPPDVLAARLVDRLARMRT